MLGYVDAPVRVVKVQKKKLDGEPRKRAVQVMCMVYKVRYQCYWERWCGSQGEYLERGVHAVR